MSSSNGSVTVQSFSDFGIAGKQIEAPMPGGKKVFIRIPAASDSLRIATFPPKRRIYALVAMSVVDEQGDTMCALSEEEFVQKLDPLPFDVWSSLVAAVEAYCQPSFDYEELAKNLPQIRSE